MKTQKRTFLKTLCTMVALLTFTFSSYAVVGGGNNGNGGGNVDEEITGTNNIPGNNGNDKPVGNVGPKKDKSIPLDGGLSVLLLGAAAFGIKKLREK